MRMCKSHPPMSQNHSLATNHKSSATRAKMTRLCVILYDVDTHAGMTCASGGPCMRKLELKKLMTIKMPKLRRSGIMPIMPAIQRLGCFQYTAKVHKKCASVSIH